MDQETEQQAASRGGRPVNPNSTRRLRTYREKLNAAGTDVNAIIAANAWARANGVEVAPAAELVERNAVQGFTRAPAHDDQANGPVVDVPYSVGEPSQANPASVPAQDQANAAPEPAHQVEGETVPEVEAVADPSAFPDLGGADPTAPPPPPPPPRRPPEESYMGENPDLVASCAQAPAFVFGALARLTEGRAIDLTKPVKVTLFKGTKLERSVDADPVVRLSELTGVAMARGIEATAAAAEAAGDAGGGKPGVLMELLPLGLAFGAAVLVPSAEKAKGIAVAAGGWLLRGARGAATRLLGRRR